MRTILCMNAKGGCGKTTLATNLAVWYADCGEKVTLADFDPQRSSIDWLAARDDYEGIPEVTGLDCVENPDARPERGTDLLVVDVPAGIYGKEINRAIRKVDIMLIPVLASPIDMRAVARYIEELHKAGRIVRGTTRVALIENRVRENSKIFQVLEDFLKKYDIPVLTHLRESQIYIKAAETGLGIFELPASMAAKDVALWDPIVEWLERG